MSTKPSEGDTPTPPKEKNHSDTPTIIFIGVKIVEVPFSLDDFNKLVERQSAICVDMHGLEEARPTYKEEIEKAKAELRNARAAERLNEQIIAECKDELVRVVEGGAKGILREQRTVREEFLRGEILVYENETGVLLLRRQALPAEFAKATEFRGADGRPMSGLIEPTLDQLTPRDRARRLLDEDGGKKAKKAAENKDKATDGQASDQAPAPADGQGQDEAPAPAARGKRATRPGPNLVSTPPAPSADDPPLLA